MSDAFISYSRNDSEAAMKLKAFLESQSLDAWIDTEGLPAGVIWREDLARAVEDASCVVVVVTPDALASEYVRDEVNHGVQNGKPVIPVVLGVPAEALRSDQRTKRPDGLRGVDFDRLPRWLREAQAIDAMDGDLDRVLPEVAAAVRRDHEWNRAHASLLVRARRWSQGAGALLSDADLAGARNWLDQAGGRPAQPTDLHRSYIRASEEAERRRRVEKSRSLASLVLAGFDDPDLGLLVACANVETLGPTPPGTLALDHELRRSRSLGPVGAAGGIVGLRLLEGGDRILLVYLEGSAWVVSTKTDEVLHRHAWGNGRILAISSWGTLAVGDGARLRLVEVSAKRERMLEVWSAGDFAHGDFDASGRYLMTANHHGGTWLWDVDDGRPVVELVPEGRSAEGSRRWRRRDREPIVGSDGGLRTRYAARGNVTSLALSADGSLAAAARDYTDEELAEVTVHTTKTARQRLSFTVRFTVNALQLHPDGGSLAYVTGGDGFLRRLDASEVVRLGDRIVDLVFSPDGARLAAVGADGFVRVLDAASLAVLAVVGRHDLERTIRPSMSAGGSRLATGVVGASARLWNLEGHGETRRIDVRECPDQATIVNDWGYRPVSFVGVSPNGSQLCAAAEPLLAGVWDLDRDGAPRQIYPAPYEGRLAWLPDGSLVGIPYLDLQSVMKYGGPSFTADRLIPTLGANGNDEALGGRYVALAVSRDGRRLAVIYSGPGNRVDVYEFPDLKRLISVEGSPIGSFYWQDPVALSRDGELLLVGNTKHGYEIRQVTGNCPVGAPPGLDEPIDAAAFSPASDCFAFSSKSVVVIRNPRDDKETRFLGHRGRVGALAFFVAGDRLVTGSDDGSARVWDTGTGEELRRLDGFDAAVTSVDSTPDGNRVVTGSTDGMVRIWNLWPVKEMLEQIGGRVSRRLTEEERRRFGFTTPSGA